jgi:hypothetical protein
VSPNRPSSPDLAQAAIIGIRILGGEVKDYGVITTPMLHYFVACINTDGVYGEATEDGYFKKMITAFKKLRGDVSFVSTIYCCIIYHLLPHLKCSCFIRFLRASSITKGTPIMQVHDSVKCVAQKLGTIQSTSRIMQVGVHNLYVK